jgi:DNA invertase Pin-like site-specific DNA recombinase
MKAIAYVRSAATDSEAVERQQEAVRSFCVRHGIQLLGAESDIGVSGLSEERVGLERLLKRLEDEEVDCVIVTDHFRLSRNLAQRIRFEKAVLTRCKRLFFVSDEPK